MATATFTNGPLHGKSIAISSISAGQNTAAANTYWLLMPWNADVYVPGVQSNHCLVIAVSAGGLSSFVGGHMVYENAGAGAWTYVPPAF